MKCNFETLPDRAKEIAHEVMAKHDRECDIRTKLDNSKSFREAVNSDKRYMKEVDYCMQYWRTQIDKQH